MAPGTSITKVVHEDSIDPNFAFVAAVSPFAIAHIDLLSLLYVSQRNDKELTEISGGFANVFHTTRKCQGRTWSILGPQ